MFVYYKISQVGKGKRIKRRFWIPTHNIYGLREHHFPMLEEVLSWNSHQNENKI